MVDILNKFERSKGERKNWSPEVSIDREMS